MPEIIPNWHPIFVHFSIALLSVATLLFVVGNYTSAGWKETCLKAAHINLWLGALISIGTVIAGLLAAGSVAHDSESHAHMMNHRNWAIPTAGFFIILAIWSAVRYRKSLQRSLLFLGFMVIATGALAVTGFKGGELVYRHGTGVMSLPDSSGKGHAGHVHSDGGHGHESEKNQKSQGYNDSGHEPATETKPVTEDSHEGHNHAH
jgi:uncharacterized membrane protein